MKAVLTAALLMTTLAVALAPTAAACAFQPSAPLGQGGCAATTLANAQTFAKNTYNTANETANETAATLPEP